MGYPVAPVVADIWMEHFEQIALESSAIKPKIWLRYVDDTFTILKRNQVDNFLNHLNSLHPKIKFTLELESNNELAFLDVKVMRKPNGSLSHTVFRKTTHTDRYLHASSHHHPSNLKSVAASLINRAHRLCDPAHIKSELKYIDKTLERNGYSKRLRTWKPSEKTSSENTVPDKKAFLPYVCGVTDRIGRVLRRYGIKTIFKPPTKIRELLRSPKDKILFENPGVYAIPCDCEKVYIGETKRNVHTRLKEHMNAIRNEQASKSAIYEHLAENNTHELRHDAAKILASERFYIPRIVRESIEIRKHRNFNRDQSFKLSNSWDPIINRLQPTNFKIQKRESISLFCRQPSNKNETETENQQPSHRYPLRSGTKHLL